MYFTSGVGQALDVDGTRKLDLSFLILDHGKIFQTLAQSSLNVSESQHVKKAAIEIILYLMKSEHIFDRQSWKMISHGIIHPNLPLIEACFNEHGGILVWIKDKYSNPEGTI